MANFTIHIHIGSCYIHKHKSSDLQRYLVGSVHQIIHVLNKRKVVTESYLSYLLGAFDGKHLAFFSPYHLNCRLITPRLK